MPNKGVFADSVASLEMTTKRNLAIDGGQATAVLYRPVRYSPHAITTDLPRWDMSVVVVPQRGFQANTRIVSVVDELLADVVNMKR